MDNHTDQDDEIEIELREPAVVAERVILLASLLRRLAVEGGADRGASAAQAEVFDEREWLREQKLFSSLTDLERSVLEAPLGYIAESDRIAVSWQIEALAALLWSLGRGPRLAPWHQADFAKSPLEIPAPWDDSRTWTAEAALQPEETIARERDVAELWHWRATVESLSRSSSPRDRESFASAIGETVTEAEQSGLLATVIAGDFAVDEVPVRELPDDRIDDLLATTTQRLHALNWVCGFGATWDAVPLDI